MSFTTQIKDELTTLSLTETEKIALLSGFFRNNAVVQEGHLILTSENSLIVEYLTMLLNAYEKVKYVVSLGENNNFSKRQLYLIDVYDNIAYLTELLCLFTEVPDHYLVAGIEEQKGYLRGVFLTSGSINDPKTSRYHMEIFMNHPQEAVFVQKILNCFDLNAKLLNRDKGYMVYLKEAEKISDFLKLIGAMKAVLYFETIRVYHEKKNQTNRLNNCEQANTDRVIETATQQLHYIDILRENLAVELLDDKTKEALIYREKYPEASLKELSEIISLETGKALSKSGLNHRFRKIKALASKFVENDNS